MWWSAPSGHRPIALSRKNALFAGSHGGGDHWAVVASVIETCKLCDVESHAYLADVITKIVTGHPNSQSAISCRGPTQQRPHTQSRRLKTPLTMHLSADAFKIAGLPVKSDHTSLCVGRAIPIQGTS